ncbi:MAG: glycosyltransferase [Candidatus Acidiferrales bacterium]
MRILTYSSILPNSLQPTQGIFTFQRLGALSRRPNNHVDFVAPLPYAPIWLPKGSRPAYSRILASETMDGLRIFHPRYALIPKISMPWHGRLMYLGTHKTIEKLHGENPYDLLDAQYIYPDGYAGVLIAKKLGIPVVLSALGTDVNIFPKFKRIAPKIRWALSEADGILAVSNSLKATTAAAGAPAEKIRVIGNGVDTARFHPLDRTEARRALRIEGPGPFVISVGTLDPNKGHQLLIAAVAELTGRYPAMKAYIAGEGPYQSALTAQIREKKIADRVVLIGKRPHAELNSWFNAANVSCLLSEREGWPNVLLESLAAGTPVIATRAGGIAEVISSPALGTLVERNVPAVTAALDAALKRDWDRPTLVAYASQRTWDKVAEEIEAYFQEILEARPPAKP